MTAGKTAKEKRKMTDLQRLEKALARRGWYLHIDTFSDNDCYTVWELATESGEIFRDSLFRITIPHKDGFLFDFTEPTKRVSLNTRSLAIRLANELMEQERAKRAETEV